MLERGRLGREAHAGDEPMRPTQNKFIVLRAAAGPAALQKIQRASRFQVPS
jgi:hypothetical protein